MGHSFPVNLVEYQNLNQLALRELLVEFLVFSSAFGRHRPCPEEEDVHIGVPSPPLPYPHPTPLDNDNVIATN